MIQGTTEDAAWRIGIISFLLLLLPLPLLLFIYLFIFIYLFLFYFPDINMNSIKN